MSETPARRPTGSIPLSWARPAEDVSADVDAAGPGVPVAAVVAFIVVAIAAGLVLARRVVPAPTPSAFAATAAPASTAVPMPAPLPPALPPPPAPPAPPAPSAPSAPSAPPPPPVVLPAAAMDPTLAPEDDDTLAAPLDDAAKKAAQASLKKARLAARDDDNARAIALVEDAVAKDPRCYECWSTLAFLRGKVGDVEGQRVAKLQARALKP